MQERRTHYRLGLICVLGIAWPGGALRPANRAV